ncbi:MAG: dicarboxylate/amino acid:cation symporter [Simkaniaceae bacterium]|nr:dicarboxylate/amino acid:cation symporter [Simkaniaceae bacterium]
MVTALILGLVVGYFDLEHIHRFADIISKLFINMLKLISLPMIFLAIVSTLTKMESLSEAGSLLKRILKYTIATTLIAAAVGMILFLIIHPVSSEHYVGEALPKQGNYLSFLVKIIPENPVQPFLENNVLAMAFLATIFSVAVIKLPKENRTILKNLFGALFSALLKITSGLILLMPIGIFAFTVQFMQSIKGNADQLEKLLLYGSCVIGANLIQGLIVLPLIVKLKGGSPLRTAKAMFPALTMAFFTKSSNATLPLALDCAKNRLGVSDKTASFSLPLCSIINMNGCAAFILITLFFVCGSQGISFTPFEMIPWIFLASFAAIGNAGVPMGCFFLTTAFLIGMGVPVELMGIILPLYSLFDMVETALNVWSDSCITHIVDSEAKAPSQNPLVEAK